MEHDIVETDVLIIGAGIAGCRAAIEAQARGARVLLTTKGLFAKDCGATWMAHNAYQCWGIYSHDTLDVHVEDTLKCGWFLNNQENVYAFLAHAPDTAADLIEWGSRFKMKNDQLETFWTLGCSTSEGRSIFPSRGDHGDVYLKIFPHLIRTRKIDVMEDVFIMDLINDGNTIVGAAGIDIRTGRFKVFVSKATILSTGGYQGLYRVTTANPNLTGDGQAIALRAGVDMMDFEFNQTLPVALWPPEIVGKGLPFGMIAQWDGRMYNSNNERFMSKWDPVKMERSTRAIISRAIFHEIKEGKVSPHGGIYVGITHQPVDFIEKVKRHYQRLPTYAALGRADINLATDYIEAGYAIHYCQGGCDVSTRCETDKPGLYAVGEVASGGKDGSDRMMANALPYCMAMGTIAGREAAQWAATREKPTIDKAQVEMLQRNALALLEREDGTMVYQVKSVLQDIVVGAIGYGRTEEGLTLALKEVERYKSEVIPNLSVSNKSKRFNLEWINALEFKNLILIAECIIRNALIRTESRGLHDRWDFPSPDPNWYKNIHLRLVDGELKQWTTPVEFKYWRPEEDTLGDPWHKAIRVKEYNGWRAEPLYKGMQGREHG